MIYLGVIFLISGLVCLCIAHEGSEAPSIEIVGSKFFFSDTGEQFFMKGIAYQPKPNSEKVTTRFENFKEDETNETVNYVDPLGDPNICLRDIPYFQRLGVNTIRVYAINPFQDHEICMKSLSEAGIYVIVDLSEPNISINRDNPIWDVTIWNRYRQVIDAMHPYSNILGFFAGNEVTNDKTNTEASAFVKAAVRDTKAYIENNNYRKIPVGYSTNDDMETRNSLSKYFICGDTKVDFYGINMYEWCGYSSFEISGYKERTQEFKNYPVPIFFSEFGCNLIRPRPFTEVQALYGSQMSEVWSGGIVYMYFEEENKYGVVEIDDQTGEPTELEDFKTLSTAFNKVEPQVTHRDNYTTFLENRRELNINCPSLSYMWKANEKLPPTPKEEKCECIAMTQPCVIVPLEDKTIYKDTFDYVCGQVDCSDIKADGILGYYGDFSECSIEQKLSLELSKLFLSQEKSTMCPYEDKGLKFKNKDLNTKSKQQEEKCLKYFKSKGSVKEGKTTVNNKEKSSTKSEGNQFHLNKILISFVMIFLPYIHI